jgi:hypothetical protein
MDIGIDSDPEAIPDPHRIAELFHKGLDQMETLGAGRRGVIVHRAPARPRRRSATRTRRSAP